MGGHLITDDNITVTNRIMFASEKKTKGNINHPKVGPKRCEAAEKISRQPVADDSDFQRAIDTLREAVIRIVVRSDEFYIVSSAL